MSSDILVLKAEKRQEIGTGSSRAIRRRGMVPAVIYGAGKEPVTIEIEEREITKYYRKPQYISQVIRFETEADSYTVLPKAIQLHPITDIVTHADFVFLNDDIQTMELPIVYANKENCIGIKRGGYFNTVRRSLKVSCPVDKLLRKIEVDTTSLPIGTSLKAKDIELPEGIILQDNPELVVASIIGKKGKATEEDQQQEPAAPAKAAPAKAAPAKAAAGGKK